MNLNKVIIIGNVTQDPEVRTTPSGDHVTNFSVATNRIWKDKNTGEKQQKTEFHNIVAWRRLAEIAGQYLNKGSLVMIEGRLETRNWEDQNGTRKYRTEIIAENMQLGPKRTTNTDYSATSEDNKTNSPNSKGADEEELPTVDVDTPTNTNTSDDEVDIKDIPF